MNINIKITRNDFYNITKESIESERKHAQIIYQTKGHDKIRNHIRKYANENGLYFVELDEFTDIYIDEVVDLYKKLSDNDSTILYLNMYDVIDYSTGDHKKALSKLYRILAEGQCNLQIIIDYHIDTTSGNDQIPIPLRNRCYTWEIK